MATAIAQQFFLDPISGKPLGDENSTVMINQCGHFYNDSTLRRWLNETKQRKCPLCQASIQSLIEAALIGQAAAIVNTSTHREYTQLNQFTDEDRETVEAAIQDISKKRASDTANNTPVRLDPYFGSSISSQVAACIQASKTLSSCGN